MDDLATALKVMGHPERLRILAILSYGELTVSELVHILGLSQPRITQYIKSLEDAGIIERLKEGSWVFSRLNRGNAPIAALLATVLNSLPENDSLLLADRRKLEDIRAMRAKSADAFFADVANDRGQLGDEYLPQTDIEARLSEMIGPGPFDFMVDLGTGTGRMLDLFAGRIQRGTGIDNSADMLKVARHNLSGDNQAHISLRLGDLRGTPLNAGIADVVTLHQVLHFLDNPDDAIREAARLLKSGGMVLIVDFESHDFEIFRDKYAHRRLGFNDQSIANWLTASGLSLETTETITGDEDRPGVKIWKAVKTARAEKAS